MERHGFKGMLEKRPGREFKAEHESPLFRRRI
jgi:hypothetical protein